MNHFAAYSMMAISVLIGGGSLLLFGVFLVIGPLAIVRFYDSEHQILLWDGFLSLLFFIQHSGMIRTSFRDQLAHIMPRHYHPSFYAIASGIVLTAVVLFWHPSQMFLYGVTGSLRLLVRTISVPTLLVNIHADINVLTGEIQFGKVNHGKFPFGSNFVGLTNLYLKPDLPL